MIGSHPSFTGQSFLRLIIVGVLLAFLLTAFLPAGIAQEPPVQVNFRAEWHLSVNHAGLLIAREQGYFEEEGLSVEVYSGSGSSEALRHLATEQVEFAYVDASILARGVERNMPVKSLGVLFRKNPQTIVWDADEQDIQTPKDLRGKTVGGATGGSTHQLFLAFLESTGLSEENLRLIGIGTSIQPLLAGQIDAMIGYTTGETIKARLAGINTEEFLFRDHGVELYGLTLSVHEDFYNRHPAQAQGFRRALIKGTREAFENPERAIRLVLETNPETNRAYERELMNVLKNQGLYGNVPEEWLSQSSSKWEQSIELLVELNMLDDPISPEDIMVEQ